MIIWWGNIFEIPGKLCRCIQIYNRVTIIIIRTSSPSNGYQIDNRSKAFEAEMKKSNRTWGLNPWKDFAHNFVSTCACSIRPTLCHPMEVVCQAPLSVEFSRQEYWSGLLSPTPGNLPDPRIKPLSPSLAGGFFTTEPPGKPLTWSSLFCYSSTILQKNIFHFCYNCFFSQLNVTENSVKTLGSIKSPRCNLTLSLSLTVTVVLD